MCGIAGLLGGAPIETGPLLAMGAALSHRGPDDGDVWIDATSAVGLSHRRLSIVDLSPCGRQPMRSSDGRWVLCYNGEIYNHRAIRTELEAAGGGPPNRAWRGHSDTETLLEAIAFWGLEATLSRAAGMWAFALWDERERTLHLVRDRFGEKPLFYGWVAGRLAFASELKALYALPGFGAELDRGAIASYARRTYVPAPRTVWQGLFKAEPGTITALKPEAARHPRREPPRVGEGADGLSVRRYWDYRQVLMDGARQRIGSEAEALEQLDAQLTATIADQAVADVPVGAFLSGGVDSSAVVAFYARHAPGRVNTYTIGFEDAAFNEAPHARAVAEHLGTRHHERTVTVRETQDLIPRLPEIWDEPFADSSQIPTFLVAEHARGDVTVALSGDGGDELFGGYNRHIAAARLWGRLKHLPLPVRRALGAPLAAVPPSVWDALARAVPGVHARPLLGAKLQKGLTTVSRTAGLPGLFGSFLDEWPHAPAPVLGAEDAREDWDLDLGENADDLSRMLYADATSYLPDDILVKVDRAAMAVSLETRVPFLDHRVAELAARIPSSMKLQGGRGKAILRKLLYRHVPAAIIDRPKTGFGIPVGKWITGPLRPWAEALLDARRLRDDGIWDVAAVRRRWEQHLAGTRDGTQAIWAVLMFQAWADAQARPDAQAPAPALDPVALAS